MRTKNRFFAYIGLSAFQNTLTSLHSPTASMPQFNPRCPKPSEQRGHQPRFMDNTVCFNAKKSATDEKLKQRRRTDIPLSANQLSSRSSKLVAQFNPLPEDNRNISDGKIPIHKNFEYRRQESFSNVKPLGSQVVKPLRIPLIPPSTSAEIVLRNAQRTSSRSFSLSRRETTASEDFVLSNTKERLTARERSHSAVHRSKSGMRSSQRKPRIPNSNYQNVPKFPSDSKKSTTKNGDISIEVKASSRQLSSETETRKQSPSPRNREDEMESSRRYYPAIWDVLFSTAERQCLHKRGVESTEAFSLEGLPDLMNRNRRDTILTLSHSSGRSSIDEFNFTPFLQEDGSPDGNGSNAVPQIEDQNDFSSTPRKRLISPTLQEKVMKSNLDQPSIAAISDKKRKNKLELQCGTHQLSELQNYTRRGQLTHDKVIMENLEKNSMNIHQKPNSNSSNFLQSPSALPRPNGRTQNRSKVGAPFERHHQNSSSKVSLIQ